MQIHCLMLMVILKKSIHNNMIERYLLQLCIVLFYVLKGGNNVMAALTQREKNNIIELKKEVGRLLLYANQLTNLSILEKELLADIMDRQTIDRVGNYDGRMKILWQDLYICAGMVYRHSHYETLKQICCPEPVKF